LLQSHILWQHPTECSGFRVKDVQSYSWDVFMDTELAPSYVSDSPF
jgi:hypothetical protein